METENINNLSCTQGSILEALFVYLNRKDFITLIRFLENNLDVSPEELSQRFVEQHRDIALKILVIGGLHK